jgi:hypothetical protein
MKAIKNANQLYSFTNKKAKVINVYIMIIMISTTTAALLLIRSTI